MKNPKAKGNGFELKVAKKLSEWAGVKFMRTPMSGAIHNFNDKRVVSDIVAPLSIGSFPFSIECKCQEVPWDFDFILKGTSTFWSFWEQASCDADSEGLIPMLIMTKNYRDSYVAIPVDVFVILFHKKVTPNYLTIKFSSEKVKSLKNVEVAVLNFDEFLSSVTVEEILSLKNFIQ